MQKPRVRRRRFASLHAVESLDRRCLLTSSLAGGILTITGTSGNNTIDVSLVSSKIRVKESGLADKDYTASQVTKISIDVKAGNDKITVGSTITKPTSIIGGSGNDTVSGGGGKDTIKGGDGNDSLSGNNNNDALQGDNGNDTLRGGAGVDGLLGGAGNDDLDGGLGNDYLDGQAGNDTADYASRASAVTATIKPNEAETALAGGGGQAGESDAFASLETLAGGSGADHLDADAASKALSGESSPPSYQVLGNGGNDTLYANGEDNSDYGQTRITLHGGGGNDHLWFGYLVHTYIYGDDGDDEISDVSGFLDTRPATVVGGAGHDLWVYGQDSLDSVHVSIVMDPSLEDLSIGTEGSEDINVTGNSLANKITVSTQGGNVTVSAGDGNDTIIIPNRDNPNPQQTLINCGNGNDFFQDETYPDSYYSTSKNNVLGGNGNDTILGATNDDSLSGGLGNDSIDGGAGNDFIDGDIGGFQTSSDIDTLNGGDGNDTIYSSDTGTNLVHGNAGNDSLYGSTKLDTIFGDAGNDLITGSSGNDQLHGGAGNDTIQAGDGNDTLFGDSGIDSLLGENGDDVLDDSFDPTLSNSIKDYLNGGAGTDSGTCNIFDIRISMENLTIVAS